jgi:hypothetical protein
MLPSPSRAIEIVPSGPLARSAKGCTEPGAISGMPTSGARNISGGRARSWRATISDLPAAAANMTSSLRVTPITLTFVTGQDDTVARPIVDERLTARERKHPAVPNFTHQT